MLTVTDFGGQRSADMRRQNSHDPRGKNQHTQGGGSWLEVLRLDRRGGIVPFVCPSVNKPIGKSSMNFAPGYELKDHRVSIKQGLAIRRIRTRDGTAFSICPSFLMPYLTAHTAEVETPLFWRKFGVPFWALGQVYGRDPMFWYRLECQLGHFSIVGTTVRKAKLPQHLVADEHHQSCDGQKIYIAITVTEGCCWGAEPAKTAGTDDLKAAYGVFQQEARDVVPDYAPTTVNTDGWKWTQAAWKALFPRVVLLLCILHGWLKIRDRAKHLGELFWEIGRRVWEAYRAPDRRSFGQRLRRLRQWASGRLSGVVQEKVLDLCSKRTKWSLAYTHPDGHRTSNMLDRIMRRMNGYFDAGGHLHGSQEASRLHCRALGRCCGTSRPGAQPRPKRMATGRVPPNASMSSATMRVGCKTRWSPPPSADTENFTPKSVTVSVFLDTGMRPVSNACSREPGEVPDNEVNAHLGNPGLD